MMAQPSQGEYSVLLQTKGRLEGIYTELQLHQEYETMPSPDKGRGNNLLDYLVRGQKGARQGVRLAADVAAVVAQLDVVNRRFAEWEAADEAFREEQNDDNGE